MNRVPVIALCFVFGLLGTAIGVTIGALLLSEVEAETAIDQPEEPLPPGRMEIVEERQSVRGLASWTVLRDKENGDHYLLVGDRWGGYFDFTKMAPPLTPAMENR